MGLVLYGLVLLSMEQTARQEVVAVSRCIAGPSVSAELGQTVGQLVVAGLGEAPGVRIIDRSVSRSVVDEQDLLLVTQAAEVLPPQFGSLGANRLVVVSLSQTTAGLFLGLRLLEVPTGQMIASAVYVAPSERRLLDQAKTWAKEFGSRIAAASDQTSQEAPALDSALEAMWEQIQGGRARELIGPDLDRAESVYRQYRSAVQSGAGAEARRLAQVAGVYLTDCLCLLQRAAQPPEGMVYVPPGSVVVALPSGKTKRFTVDGFFVDRCEYTRGEYAAFLEATGHAKPPGWSEASAAENPRLAVAGVDWRDADDAARWQGMRLPTYLEYLRACRGDGERKYPWGEMWRAELCNFLREPSKPQQAPVGSHPNGASYCGVLDSVGGVSEWLDTWQSADYWDHAALQNPRGPERGSAKLVVGGSFRSGPAGCTCETVEGVAPGTRRDDLGFRCVLPVKGLGRSGE